MNFDLVVRSDKNGKIVASCLSVPNCEGKGATLREAVDKLIDNIVTTISSNLRTSLKQSFNDLPEELPADKFNGEFSALFTNFPVSPN